MITDSNTPHIRLVGSTLVSAGEPDYAWFGNTFTRITREVQHTGALTRLVGYESRTTNCCLRLFGIEVECIADIPDGLLGWELHDNTWTIYEDGQVIWQAEISWQWNALQDSRWTGEFTAPCPPAWGENTAGFATTANAYLKLPDPHFDDDVELVDPDPDWPRHYAEFAAWLRSELGEDVALRIEHYGSTAIPGIPAKPIIDVLVEVPSFAAARQRALSCLNHEEWEYWQYGDHLIFIKRQSLMGRRTHHVHLAPRGHRLWDGLAFRDYLRAYPETATRYAALKRELAAQHRDDREAYTAAKTAFVQEITVRALAGLAHI